MDFKNNRKRIFQVVEISVTDLTKSNQEEISRSDLRKKIINEKLSLNEAALSLNIPITKVKSSIRKMPTLERRILDKEDKDDAFFEKLDPNRRQKIITHLLEIEGLKPWMIQMILGVSSHSLEKIRESIRTTKMLPETRSGVDDTRSWSEFKHKLNDILCTWMRDRLQRPLRILETHQGIGKGTDQYRRFGVVVSFERDRRIYDIVKDRFSDAISLYEALDQGISFDYFLSRKDVHDNYLVLLPTKPFNSVTGMNDLTRHSAIFDIIDIDPQGSADAQIKHMLPLLEKEAILFITCGQMHMRRYGFGKVMRPYCKSKVDDYNSGYIQKNCARIIGAALINRFLHQNLCLFPIFIYDCYIQSKKNGEKRRLGGIQRLAFYTTFSKAWQIQQKVKSTIEYNYTLDTQVIVCEDVVKIAKSKELSLSCVPLVTDQDDLITITPVLLERLTLITDSLTKT